MPNMYVYPYKTGSNGAKELSAALGVKQIKREGSKFKGSKEKIVINWGSSTMNEEASKCIVLNKPESVAVASNKLSFFNAIEKHNAVSRDRNKRVLIPDFFTSADRAARYANAGYTIVARTVLNGHSGKGIILCETEKEVYDANAPLYVLYIPKKQEYRIHVLNGGVVDIQRKARRLDIPDDQVDWKIRNHDNGFIYARKGVDVPKTVLSNSVNAVEACGLDFGAVDVIYNDKNKLAYVLEINTAPGLTGETLEGYKKRFAELAKVTKEVEYLLKV